MEKENNLPQEVEAVLILHVGKDFANFGKSAQIEILEKKRSRYRIMIAVNVFALLFFTYSFIGGITQLNDIVYYVLGTVFVLNVLLIFYQRKQINITLDYLRDGR